MSNAAERGARRRARSRTQGVTNECAPHLTAPYPFRTSAPAARSRTSAALFARFTSRQDDSPAMRLVAALWQQFGDHAVTGARGGEQDEPVPGVTAIRPATRRQPDGAGMSLLSVREHVCPTTGEILLRLWWCWRRNWSVGRAERARGLHYWLGYEYALILATVDARPGQRWVDVGAGAHSVFPYLLAAHSDVAVLGVDITDRLSEQAERTSRAVAVGLVAQGQVGWSRGDARRLPLSTASADGVTAVSALEHLTGGYEDRTALREVHRVLKPGGQAVVTVPFRWAGSVVEHRDKRPYQRLYSPATVLRSFVGPAGLDLQGILPYGERLPFYALSRRLPGWADRLRRPVDTALSAILMTPYRRRPDRASAVLLFLRKPMENTC